MPLSSRNTRVRFLIQNQRAFIILWLCLKFRIDDSFLILRKGQLKSCFVAADDGHTNVPVCLILMYEMQNIFLAVIMAQTADFYSSGLFGCILCHSGGGCQLFQRFAVPRSGYCVLWSGIVPQG